jgi:hypothetical protein
MKMNNNKLKRGKLLGVGLLITIVGYSQLPTDYVTKVNYHEKKEVTYSLPSEAGLNCLTLSELSQYHGYMQFYTMDEYVDQDGELLTDQNFIEERHVRDEWMEGYSRITVGKNTIDVYTKESGLRTQIEVVPDEEDVFMTNEQAMGYGFLDLNEEYYLQLRNELQDAGLNVLEGNNMLSASNEFASIAYDSNAKVVSATEYDSEGLKTKESVIEFDLNFEEDTYFPTTETIIEWFLGKNGCCIRKTTVIRRYAYTREVTQGGSPEREESTGDNVLGGGSNAADYEVLTEQNSDIFRISSKKFRKKEIEVIVYDMAGKQVLHAHLQEGQAIKLPQASRAGMYLVHIVSENRHVPVVGKIIKNSAGSQF